MEINDNLVLLKTGKIFLKAYKCALVDTFN